MKLTYKNTDSFLKAPDPKIKVVLVYGPDEGLVRERVNILGKTVTPDLHDTFNVVDLNSDQIKEDPSLLSSEAFSISMMGGRRFIRIRGGKDSLTSSLKDLLTEADKIDHLIVIQAGDLPPKSSLRKLCEKEKTTASLACYVEDERDVSRFLSQFFRENELTITPDALNLAASLMAGDRGVIRQEAHKILTYKGNETSPIDLDDVRACLGASTSESTDTLIQSIASGNVKTFEHTYRFLLSEGTAPVMILRIAKNYFKRLYTTHGHMETLNFEQAIKKLYPPVFFKVKGAFQSQLRHWSIPRLEYALKQIQETERRIKQSGSDPHLICNRALLSLTKMGARR